MHDQPQPTEEEQELANESRLSDEDAQRYPGHDDPPEPEPSEDE